MMKGRKPGNIILYALSMICMLYGLTVVTILGTTQWFNYAFLLVGAIFGIWAVMYDRIDRSPVILKRLLFFVFTVSAAFFLAVESFVVSYASGAPAENADYVIILGAKVNGETPSLEFSRRISTAADYLKKNPSSAAIATGGKGNDENIAESSAALYRLLSLGIDANRILTEAKSTSTEENLRFAAGVIRQDGGDPEKDSVVIVSSSFHLFRAGLHARKEGFMNVSFLGCTGLKVLIPHYYLREFAALVYEVVL